VNRDGDKKEVSYKKYFKNIIQRVCAYKYVVSIWRETEGPGISTKGHIDYLAKFKMIDTLSNGSTEEHRGEGR
jgi:hypothetical protein